MEARGMSREDIYLNTRRLHEAGVRLVAGSDAGIGDGKPHGILLESLVELAGCMPSADALASATSFAAQVCGLGSTKGRLRPGYDADVVVVDGNPLVDMADIRRIRQVVLAGTVVDRGLMQT
jgi:imidazolonepropionase-like amidohydrolase